MNVGDDVRRIRGPKRAGMGPMNPLENAQIRVFLQKLEAAARQQLTEPFIGSL